jgi:hypothetical protein
MKFVEGSVKLLGLGSLAFGIWGLVHPKSLTGLMGDDPELGRLLGMRDTLVGVTLLNVAGPIPLAMRVASDLHDAIRLRKRSPIVGLGAAVIALWGAAALGGRLGKRAGRNQRPGRSDG